MFSLMFVCRDLLLAQQYFLSPFSVKDTAPTEIYTLSLHDALPIWSVMHILWLCSYIVLCLVLTWVGDTAQAATRDRKSTRLNSSHTVISYAVFCLKKKNRIPLTLAKAARTVVMIGMFTASAA